MPQIREFGSRDTLRRRVVAAFAARPEVYAIHAFGREVDGLTDAYSDIDLIICSDDLPGSQRSCDGLLDSISPVIGTYWIICDERQMARMVMFRDYSPYQKLDFSIVDGMEQRKEFEPLACLYRRERPARPSPGNFTFDGQRHALRNWLNDALFSIPRFTKCLFRADRDLYRRWVAATENLAVLLYESRFGWSREHRYRLGPHEYKLLYQHLPVETEARLERIQPLHGSPNLPGSYLLAMEWTIELYEAKAAALSEPIDFDFVDHMRRFLRDEIGRYCRGTSA